MFTTVTTIEAYIGMREFCIPTNHPWKQYMDSTAGAPQMQMRKYATACRSTSPLVPMSQKASRSMGYCSTSRAAADSHATANACTSTRACPASSLRP